MSNFHYHVYEGGGLKSIQEVNEETEELSLAHRVQNIERIGETNTESYMSDMLFFLRTSNICKAFFQRYRICLFC